MRSEVDHRVYGSVWPLIDWNNKIIIEKTLMDRYHEEIYGL